MPKTITEVRNGSVTLSGQVTWNYQREAAGQAIRHLKGVVGLSNLITLEQLNDPHLRSTRDATGHHIQAQDGELGHVADFIIDDES